MNSRLAVAVHLLTLLEQHAGVPLPSEFLATRVNTHATVVRRMLGALAAAGITTTQRGAGGGTQLARPAAAVTLLDVYRAVEPDALFAFADAAPDPACTVGRNLVAALTPHFDAAVRAVEADLARTSIADVLREVDRHEMRRARTARRRPGAAR